MNKSKIFLLTIFVFFIGLSGVFAQNEGGRQAEPNREIILQVLVASNTSAGKTNLPSSLANVTKKLNSIYSFADYRVAMTYLERVANSGNLEYRGIADNFMQNQKEDRPVFLEWTLGGLQILPNTNNQSVAQFQNFRFGMRVPVVTGTFKAESGQTSSVVNYESTGLTVQRFNVPENTPTVIGTIMLPRTDETVFLVLTVNSIN
ncbi:MAG TPA: hypothetical protein VK892_14540 [Pyrinomonadaceae bacterium]|nr:hypothetical protein [Pyrinomonadaceae bacterium]